MRRARLSPDNANIGCVARYNDAIGDNEITCLAFYPSLHGMTLMNNGGAVCASFEFLGRKRRIMRRRRHGGALRGRERSLRRRG